MSNETETPEQRRERELREEIIGGWQKRWKQDEERLRRAERDLKKQQPPAEGNNEWPDGGHERSR